MTNKPLIIIAEDDPILRQVYVRKFRLAGYKIQTAENGEECLKLLKKNTPDAMILDVRMPVLDGYGVLTELQGKERAFPIIMLTNLVEDEVRKRCLDLGANDFFVKSAMTIESLLAMVKNLRA